MGKEPFDKALLVISLDTELAWGSIMCSNGVPSMLLSDTRNARGAIDNLLGIFHKYNIPATWAIVGHLFLVHCETEGNVPHMNMPRFKEDWYSFDPCSSILEAPLYYGTDIVEKILSNPVKHEIGCHSFSHVRFSECSREVADAEIKESIKLARQFGITFESFVFPENMLGHIDVLKENGFKIYRGRSLTRSNPTQSPVCRKPRAFIDMVAPKVVEPIWKDGIWEIPSSGMFTEVRFPYGTQIWCRQGIKRAISKSKVFHVWLHPCDLVLQPQLAVYLDEFLKIVSGARDRGKIQVMTMGELARCLGKENT